MFKQLFFSLFVYISFSLHAMQPQPRQLQPWVQAARDILIKTSSKTINEHLGIQDNSTILDIKKMIADSEGFNIQIQSLHAISSNGILKCSSQRLQDDLKVKDAMDRYNTRRFLLVIYLMNPSKG